MPDHKARGESTTAETLFTLSVKWTPATDIYVLEAESPAGGAISQHASLTEAMEEAQKAVEAGWERAIWGGPDDG